MKCLPIVLMLVISVAMTGGIACAQGYGPGYGMGPGMMGGYGGYGPGYGMGPGMMGGYGYGYPSGQGIQNEACQKFFKETAELRKELHNKRFEYSEAVRDPNASPESVGKLSKEIYDLQTKIYAKNPQNCW